MKLKFKIVFFNFMLFMIIFDVIYLVVWIFSVQMNPVKAVIVAGITALLMPWVRAARLESGSKVVIQNYVYILYSKYLKK